MKTRNVVMTVTAVIVASTFTFAGNPTSKVVVVSQNNSEIFKVIYEGTIAGRVTLKVYDNKGKQLLTETTNGLSKFIRPVNFDGMDPGEYSIEITDANGTQSQKVNYRIGNETAVIENSLVKNESSIKGVHITKLHGEGKYLMSVTTEGTKKINVRIFDETDNLVHSENVTVNGSTGLVYNLKEVQGQPTFLVIDNVGNKKVIK
jgi:hypothetical protein